MEKKESFLDTEHRSLKDQIKQSFDDLRDFLPLFSKDETLDDFEKEFTKQVDNQEFTKDSLNDLLMEHLTSNLETPNAYSFVQLYIFTHLADRAYKRLNQVKAWGYIAEARYYSGVLEANVFVMENTSKSSKDLAKAGGAGRKEKYRPIKEFVIELLNKMRPLNGWSTERSAAKAISDKVREYNIKHQVRLSNDRIEDRLTQWMKDDPSIKAAYAPPAEASQER
ncbi:hypothetical protein [Metapseudomonas otitidis]|uniref:hypothetical protein n=1 Tax=Metapseudomonas otitidis TaxID=319939 RepID=UPI00209B66DB|nr:hypothetical protein [Pseudomonas otitidis]MCO7556591.1 hypothetical protein [Pseudomonas otitidis]